MRRGMAVAAVLLAACSSGDDGGGGGGGATATTAAAGSTTTAAPVEYEATIAEAPCDAELEGAPTARCGVLTVPADRDDPAAGDVTIPYAVIPAAAPDPKPDPIVYFSGGPGGDGRGIAGFLVELGIAGADRDVVVFDQRGTGASTPSLDCPENVEVVWTLLGAAAPPLEEIALFDDGIRRCRERLVAEGVDLDAYDTPTTAADVEDLRVALGVAQWNLLGVSYGTTVALEVARRYPEGVRSVVLDSVYPTDRPNDASTVVDHAERAIGALSLGCASSPDCTVANGDLDVGLAELRDAWNADPFETTVTDPATGEPRALVITGDDVVAGLWNAMYDHTLIGVLPSLLRPLLERSPLADVVVAELAASGIDQLTGSAEGVGVGVDCADRQRLEGRPVEAVLADESFYASLLSLGGVHPCSLWDVESVAAAFNDPVRSDLPALVLGNEYDPVTPPGDSQEAAEGFANGTYVELPGLGHGAVFAHDCPRSIFRAFVADPTVPPDTSCVAAMPPPAWSTG